jgi:hypothetical protein
LHFVGGADKCVRCKHELTCYSAPAAPHCICTYNNSVTTPAGTCTVLGVARHLLWYVYTPAATQSTTTSSTATTASTTATAAAARPRSISSPTTATTGSSTTADAAAVTERPLHTSDAPRCRVLSWTRHALADLLLSHSSSSNCGSSSSSSGSGSGVSISRATPAVTSALEVSQTELLPCAEHVRTVLRQRWSQLQDGAVRDALCTAAAAASSTSRTATDRSKDPFALPLSDWLTSCSKQPTAAMIADHCGPATAVATASTAATAAASAESIRLFTARAAVLLHLNYLVLPVLSLIELEHASSSAAQLIRECKHMLFPAAKASILAQAMQGSCPTLQLLQVSSAYTTIQSCVNIVTLLLCAARYLSRQKARLVDRCAAE